MLIGCGLVPAIPWRVRIGASGVCLLTRAVLREDGFTRSSVRVPRHRWTRGHYKGPAADADAADADAADADAAGPKTGSVGDGSTAAATWVIGAAPVYS